MSNTFVSNVIPISPSTSRRLTKSIVVDNILYKKAWTLITEPKITYTMPEHFERPETFELERFFPEHIVILNKNERLSGTIITNNFIKRCIDR